MFRSFIVGAVAALAFGLAAPTLARAAPASSYEKIDAQEAKDHVIVAKAMDDFNARGAAGLAPHLRALEDVMENLPESYPLIEERGELVISRADDGTAGALAVLLGAASKNKSAQVIHRDNVYGVAAWMLAWAAVESRNPEKALRILEPMMRRQPYTVMLVAERGSALTLLQRWDEAYANYDGALQSGLIVNQKQRALLLRGKGFALIELGRLDEAEAAYKESLELDPGHGGAQNELAYIQQQKAGKPKVEAEVLTSDEARESSK